MIEVKAGRAIAFPLLLGTIFLMDDPGTSNGDVLNAFVAKTV